MFASKFWNFLLVLVIAALAVIILLVPISVNESRLENTRSILQKDRVQLEAVLKMEARARIDTTIVFAVNEDVRKYLAMANRFKKDEKFTGEEQDALLASLRKVNEKLGPMSADILFVVDRKGKVVAQIGENERSSGYSLHGFPLVDSAIRGYLRDDTWIRDGKPYRMAARPIIHQGTYQGAVVHGKRMAKDLATLLSLATKAQAAIFVDSLVTESVLPPESPAAARPDDKAAEEATEEKPAYPSDNDLNRCLGDMVFKDKAFLTKGRSGLLLCEGGGDVPESGKLRFYVTAIKFVGEARHGQAGVVIVRTVPPGISLREFVLAPERKAELAGEKATLAIIGAAALLLSVLGFLIVFFEGDRPKSKFLREVENMASREGERLNIYVFRGKYRKIADAVNRAIDGAVEVLVSKATADAPSVSKILGTKDSKPRLSKPQFEIPEQISVDDVAAPPPMAGSKPSQPSVPSVPDDEAPVEAVKPPPPKAAVGRPPLPMGAPGKPPPPKASEDPEARYKAIYKDFFDLKTACGESTDGLTFERFRATLKKQEDAIMERTKCSRVDFRVYVKEGKAALKATPVK
ncbi:MAG: hypothetical protein JRG91_20920 [Deltaproteobacteria bacterium]|nr:hypothetical protein [Deltaproteobacteria bacterium]